MTNSLPSTITITETRERDLNLSSLRYAVVLSHNNEVFALFKWKNRAEDYVKRYSIGNNIIDLRPE